MRCDHCANDVPDGVFGTRCGAHQGTTAAPAEAKALVNRYAAHPSEHVIQPSIFTTIFPHLGHTKIHEFRWGFAVGLGGILVLYIAGLITAAILVAIFLVPVLYLVYLYEAQVYRDEPAIVLGFTIGGGAVIGIVLTVLERIVYNPYPAIGNPLHNAGIGVGALLFLGLLVPVVQEVLKPLPALFLPNRADFPETVDGLVFGIAARLGFSVRSSSGERKTDALCIRAGPSSCRPPVSRQIPHSKQYPRRNCRQGYRGARITGAISSAPRPERAPCR